MSGTSGRRAAFRAQIEAHPTIMALKAAFPGAEIVNIRRPQVEAGAEAEPAPDAGENDEDE